MPRPFVLFLLAACGSSRAQAPPPEPPAEVLAPAESGPVCQEVVFEREDAQALGLLPVAQPTDPEAQAELDRIGAMPTARPEETFTSLLTQVLGASSGTGVRVDGSAVRVIGTDAHHAETGCEAAIELAGTMRRDGAANASRWLTEQIAQQQERVEAARQALTAFETEHGTTEERALRRHENAADMRNVSRDGGRSASRRAGDLQAAAAQANTDETTATHLTRQLQIEQHLLTFLEERSTQASVQATQVIVPLVRCRTLSCNSQ